VGDPSLVSTAGLNYVAGDIPYYVAGDNPTMSLAT
jgi:hypothetical protein